jgi:hypothetical protein
MQIPEAVAVLFTGRQHVDAVEQAFPFLTVDESGYPHTALLSRSELDVDPGRGQVIAVISSPRTRANIGRDGRAAVIAVDGEAAHYLKLQAARSFTEDGVLACAFDVVEHKRDAAGVPLTPISYRTSEEIARVEQWDRSARLLQRILVFA